ncbi:sialic acid-binding Ig-like lectin 12 [Mauremys reevesii]|uniref:sialic acid-binding Ig-like lectin 12 n=1 Tax=Mauremys reevesii TaxID=260615 RepID=UPI0019401C98|nr:sialic acid-binding Ig-like lectin 12 [Mauremys reevesii]
MSADCVQHTEARIDFRSSALGVARRVGQVPSSRVSLVPALSGGSSGGVSALSGPHFDPSPSPAGSLAQPPGFTLTVPQSVSVQEGLCVLVPCTFTYPASYDTDNPSAKLYGMWYKQSATVGQDPPVASSVSSQGLSQETQGRFRLTGDPAHGDCSLQISDARWTDAGRYFFSFEKGLLDHTYRSNSDGADPALTISVTGLTEEPEIQISPARGLPGTLLVGKPVTVTCTAPGSCFGPPPQVTWTGPFSDTAQNVSAQLANGTWAHSSALSFTPGPGDHGKGLVCSVTYRPPRGPSTRRTVQLHVGLPDAWRAEGNVLSLETQEGDSLSLSCEAGSRAEVILSWAKGHESLSPGLGGDGHLELFNLSREDTGEYRCWAKNSYGWASRALLVHMPSPTDGLTRAFIEMSCKLVFVATGFFLAYYLTLLYYRCPASYLWRDFAALKL